MRWAAPAWSITSVSELWSALLGALVGGLIAAVVAWGQTRVSLRHELELFREGLEADREAGRMAQRRVAATDALGAMAALDAAKPHLDHRFAGLRQDAPRYLVERQDRARQAIRELRRVEVASAPILGMDMQLRWNRLVVLADKASRAGEVMGDEAFTRAARAMDEHASALHKELTTLALA